MISFSIDGKQVSVYPSTKPDLPVIYLNTFAEEERSILDALKTLGCPDFSLVAISNLNWNHDMSPWEVPPVFKNSPPCTGGADAYLLLLTDRILPKAEEALSGRIPWRGIAGYSLAGLFALYAICRTDFFSRAASMSGSLWFPGIKEYLFSHEPKRIPDSLYFSLGDKESKTRNPLIKAVRQNTEEIAAFYRDKGIPTAFHLNPGNHYQEAAMRTALGICGMLKG